MELELGLKITHTRDDLTSTTNLEVTKDSSGPVFVSKEIDTMFILEGHLKGIRRENIDIDINKDGNRISIRGKKPVQEMVLMGWVMHKKEAVMRTFEKSFRIPDGVKLDKIKAKFSDETSVLTIRMPKREKGISRVGIEELEETTETVVDKVPERESPRAAPQKPVQPTTLEFDQIETRHSQFPEVVAHEIPEESRNLKAAKAETSEEKVGMEDPGRAVEEATDEGQSEAAKIPERDDKDTENGEDSESRTLEDAAKVEPAETVQELIKESGEPKVKSKEDNDQVVKKSQGRPENELQGATEKPEELRKQEPCAEDQQLMKPEPYQEPKADDHTMKDEVNGEDQTQPEETKETPTYMEYPSQQKIDELKCRKVEEQKSLSEEAGKGTKPVPRKSKVCTPIVVAGSAILVSIIVLVIHFIRAKKR